MDQAEHLICESLETARTGCSPEAECHEKDFRKMGKDRIRNNAESRLFGFKCMPMYSTNQMLNSRI